MPKFTIHVAETRHFEFEVEAADEEAARDAGWKEWRDAPEVGGYELPDQETELSATAKR